MEQSAPCTPEAGPLNTTRESDNMMYDSRGVQTPASGGMNQSYIGEPQSPLTQIDPHRLRDMVVDKQNAGAHGSLDSPYKQQQQFWEHNSGCPTSSPSSMRLAPNSAGSQMPLMMHSSRMSQGRSPLNSPVGVHGSSYSARPPSNAPSSPFLQPSQTPVHYPQGMQQMPQSPATNMMPSGQVPPASPGNVYQPRMNTMGPMQQQYSYAPQVQQQWNPPPQPHYVGQPQMMSSSGQRVMIQRVPYLPPVFVGLALFVSSV
ncbi:unnamed protein product [Enterobius vermicularis]|uniref:Mastermind-like domain-containing protein 1 n=1 Tax=Enterobius vermicularis TaxID=51028 RepID=A0A0N4UWJ8_ENTVE|nr:unnamed protein product [Enterobius vermicularis]